MLTVAITLSTASVYYAQQTKDTVNTRSKDIEEVVLTGVADIAKDRKTPVAVSTIKEAQIVERLGNQEFPEILNTTPSVYTTKGGGGFGDSRINIRGFANENIAVMVNGMPVNDMENGQVYWSNWAGIADVTSSMQVQRGLGSSKLAIASVGGTINILTRAADKKRGGTVSVGVGNDGYHKTLFAYNTGKSEKGWSTSFLMSRTAGAMYFDGSDFEAYNYYLAVGYQPNEKHDFQFTFTGAPQWHNQNFTNTIATYLDMGDGKLDNVKAEDPNRKYNSNWGLLNGEQFTTNRNFYSKPIMSFNWDWKMSERSKLATVAYASFGRGGGTGFLGRINGKQVFDNAFKDANGQIRWDDIVAWNQGVNVGGTFGAVNPTPGEAYRTIGTTYNDNTGRGLVRRSHINSHNWYGLLSNFNHKLSDELNFSIGIDARYYYGYHPGVVTDLLGNNKYTETGDFNTRPAGTVITGTQAPTPSANPFAAAIKDKSQIASRNYDGEVTWYGGFGQIEYSKDNFTAFVQGAISNQGFQRIDNWIIDGVTQQSGQTVNKKTGFKNILGYNVKAGANYNLDSNHNVFGNIGYFSRQPFFTGVYPNNRQVVNPNLTNEKVFSAELGYGYRSSNLRANVNLFRTSWKDRFQRRTGLTVPQPSGPAITQAYAEINGIEQVHYGVEFDATYSIGKYVDLEAMFSWGDYRYQGNAEGTIYDDNNNPVILTSGTNVTKLNLDNVKVGDAAQMTASLGATFKPVKGLRINANWRWVDQLYARFDVTAFDSSVQTPTYTPPALEKGALRLPSYNLFDLGASYKFDIGARQSLTLGANVYNLFDTTYITEATTNNHTGLTEQNFTGTAAQQATALANYNAQGTWKGIHQSNQVYFGFGRTWAANLTFNF
ncbi:outer membrane receptor protein involved in Fe transport [Chryseobacterium defluvii]|uniref:Outer membrane receptor protein involved in Fe transport n=1 Tax=Chryseobacterium defluvii TaxID=160396 RepID=A0A840KBS6_9FLAO|nr:TonB-dependent receptor [Chryseobacterium defluvii]MBB4806656.1 outer membrane receptor protein involved in Fe transport [Chryseobacterium defluvii]